jgi:hypothetical protein
VQAENALVLSSAHSYDAPEAAPVNENVALCEFVGFAGIPVIVGGDTVEAATAPATKPPTTAAAARTPSNTWRRALVFHAALV